jgi:hypothetical protein
LLDTDGYYNNSEYEYCTKSEQLANDVIFICNSLGFRVRKFSKIINNVKYYRVYIRGNNLSDIPVRIDYKKHIKDLNIDKKSKELRYVKKRKTREDNLIYYKFELIPLGLQDFYGITVDVDNKYLTSDFIVTNNSGKTARMIYTSCKNLQKGLNVAYFTLEMSEVEIGQRFDACLTEIHLEELVNNKEAIRSKLEELPGKLRIIEEEYCSTTPRRIFNKVKKLEETGFPVDLVVIDYADITAPTKSMKDDDGMVGGVQVYSEIKTLTQRFWKRTLTAAQTNREGAEAEVITPKHFEGMFKRFNPCHFVVGFSKYGKVKELKTRVGPAFLLNEEKDLGRVRTFITKIDDDGDLLDHAASEMKKAKSNKNVQSILQQFISKERDKIK